MRLGEKSFDIFLDDHDEGFEDGDIMIFESTEVIGDGIVDFFMMRGLRRMCDESVG